MSFTRKAISATFSYAQGQFSGGGNSYTASGLAMSTRITTPGGVDRGNLTLAIYGLPLSVMAQLTILPTGLTAIGNNTITLMAGDAPNPTSIVFIGTVHAAYTDASAQPNVCFRVEAGPATFDMVKSVPAISYPGTSDVATVMKGIADRAGWQFEDSGVNVKLQNVCLPGTAVQQCSALARHAGIMSVHERGVFAIWPAGQARQGPPTTISPATGMVGYPAFTASGLLVTTEFQGTLKYGCKVTVESELTPACGPWFVNRIEYALDCQIPNGSWFATMQLGKIQIGQPE